MRSYSKKKDSYTKEECLEITRKHRKSVIDIMDIFCHKVKDLWEEHINDEGIPEHLEKYKLQHLIKIVQDQVSITSGLGSEYRNTYEEDLERYLAKWLPKNLAIICRNTSVDLWNTIHKENNRKTIGKPLRKKSVEITKIHEKTVMDIMDVFCRKVKNLWKRHDKDKETPVNLEIYTYLRNNPWDETVRRIRKERHNNNPHHVEWFVSCNKPKLQYLVEMVCDNLATAIERNAKYEDIFEENKNRYMQKWLPENLAIICTNTFVDLWNYLHKNK